MDTEIVLRETAAYFQALEEQSEDKPDNEDSDKIDMPPKHES